MLYIIIGLLFLSFVLQLMSYQFKQTNKRKYQYMVWFSYILIGIAILLALFLKHCNIRLFLFYIVIEICYNP